MKKDKNIAWSLVLGATLMVGCGKEIPKEVIPPAQMERILYDYHLNLSMSSNLSYADNYQKKAYQNYLFEKHGVSEATFDSSMVWYTRHAEELAHIYKRLGVRFRSEKTRVQDLLALREQKVTVSLPGDTVDVWPTRDLFWLTEAPLTRKISFEIQADSNFKAKDGFLWSVNYTFLADQRQRAVMGFNVRFENDSVIGRVQSVEHSGRQTLYVKSDSAYAIKSLHGFIYYQNQDSVATPGVLASGISLTRYHELTPDTTAVSDTLATAAKDSIDALPAVADTAKPAVDSLASDKAAEPTRLAPQDLKDNRATRPQRIKRRN